MSTNNNKPKLGKISIENRTEKNISVTVVKYEHEEFKDCKPISITPNTTKIWERVLDASYFCFLSEARVLYGFLCKGGVSYEYIGNGEMRLPAENKKYNLEYDATPIKNSLRILAILENVQISIFKDKDLKNLVSTKLIKKNSDLKINLPDGYYYVKIKDDECIYGVIPGKCYYIAKAQVLVGTKDNIIIKPHKDADIDMELQ